MTRVFLSYARGDDEPFVRRLYGDLETAGFTVWFDRESLMARGKTFHQEIKDAIRTEVDRVVYVGGPKAAQSVIVFTCPDRHGMLQFTPLFVDSTP
ncbi:MAG TPA: toll/interleukin-1 receptor domain-containing protein [Verrucomicrobiae bacterium]|nr:toll/interleukin-1 receptor domain-containing protein [Verrucomicrobiae bacterium]